MHIKINKNILDIDNINNTITIKNIGIIKIPPRNSIDDIIKLYNELDNDNFIKLMNDYIILTIHANLNYF